jgi:3,4-dihydroxy 2-butanone 4-phosphate synthase/GTP cyclohydrolase II
MDPSQHNAGYLQTKQTKLGHLMEDPRGQGPAAVLAWKLKGSGDEPPAANLAQQWHALRDWAEREGLQVEREEHSRVLALLDQPELAVLVSGADAARLQQGLEQMARWPSTQSVSLLLAPDAQRSSHPSNTLEAQRRPLVELSQGHQSSLPLQSGALLRWC